MSTPLYSQTQNISNAASFGDKFAILMYDTSHPIEDIASKNYFLNSNHMLKPGDIMVCHSSGNNGYAVIAVHESTNESVVVMDFSEMGHAIVDGFNFFKMHRRKGIKTKTAVVYNDADATETRRKEAEAKEADRNTLQTEKTAIRVNKKKIAARSSVAADTIMAQQEEKKQKEKDASDRHAAQFKEATENMKRASGE